MVRRCADPHTLRDLYPVHLPGDFECVNDAPASPAEDDDAPFYGPLSECWDDGRPAPEHPADPPSRARDTRRPYGEGKVHWPQVYVSLPPETNARLVAYAARRGRPVVEVLRAWLIPIIDSLPSETTNAA